MVDFKSRASLSAYHSVCWREKGQVIPLHLTWVKKQIPIDSIVNCNTLRR